jgi:DNA-binding IclR family transcriptional regulator
MAAHSVSSAAQHMDDARMKSLVKEICRIAEQISRELGWESPAPKRSKKTA